MCPYCSSPCISHGTSSAGNKRYRCRSCKRTHSKAYRYIACRHSILYKIKILLKEGCGILSISRILKIGVNTILRKIRAIASGITRPNICFGKEYELDELCIYVKSKSKKRWIAYAMRKDTKEVVDFSIGSRTNNTLRKVTDNLILSNAVKVFTDKLPNYNSLLPSAIHATEYRSTNQIERKNLTLRTHLKRLSRRTICFSKNTAMLYACLKIYFWG
jgi:insertion element IS1 protein InsB